MLTIAVLLYPENAHIALNIACRLSKEGKRVIYCIYEYEPLLDSCNMTIDDYARLATDISVSDQWRIQDFPERAPTPKRGSVNYYFVQFSWKRHKNEEKWTGKVHPNCFYVDPPMISNWNKSVSQMLSLSKFFAHLPQQALDPQQALFRICTIQTRHAMLPM